MRVNDAFHGQIMLFDDRHDLVGVAARVDDDTGFTDRVADNGTVALQWPDREGFENNIPAHFGNLKWHA